MLISAQYLMAQIFQICGGKNKISNSQHTYVLGSSNTINNKTTANSAIFIGDHCKYRETDSLNNEILGDLLFAVGSNNPSGKCNAFSIYKMGLI